MTEIIQAMLSIPKKPEYTKQYVRYDLQYVPRPAGFNNPDSICWFNAAIQAMLSISSFNQVLIQARKNGNMTTNSFARAYIDLVENSLKGIAKPNDTYNLLIFMNERLKFCKMAPMANGQACAYEGISKIIETVDCPEVYNCAENIYEYRIQCPACHELITTSRDKAYQINMQGQHITTQQAFIDWLRWHTSIVDEWKCDRCMIRSKNVSRQECLRVLSEVVTIVLNKYTLKTLTYYPKELAFPSNGSTLTYKVISTIEHYGNIYGGHYVANCLRGETYKMNDSSTTMSDLEPKNETFIVIYHLV